MGLGLGLGFGFGFGFGIGFGLGLGLGLGLEHRVEVDHVRGAVGLRCEHRGVVAARHLVSGK